MQHSFGSGRHLLWGGLDEAADFGVTLGAQVYGSCEARTRPDPIPALIPTPIHLLPHPCICAGIDIPRGHLQLFGSHRAVLQPGTIQQAVALPGVLP